MDTLIKFLIKEGGYRTIFKCFGFSVSTLTLSLFLPSFFVIVIYFYMRFFSYNIVPSYLQNLLEYVYCFLYDFIYGILEEEGRPFIPYLIAIFFFILIFNLLNLVPYCVSVTGEFFINFSISFTICLFMMVLAVYRKKINFWQQFVPAGLPIFITPFVFLIEFLLFWLKPITLAFRLAITLTVGHKVLHSMVKMELNKFFIFGLLVFVLTLEILIMVIQSFLFLLLTCIFLKDMIKDH